MKIIAHRGYKAIFPENTVLSFLKAVEYGADGIELDVRMSSDNIPVIVHDPFILDKADPKNAFIISETNLETLKKISLGMNQAIPTLREVLESINKNTFIDLEFKVHNAVSPSIELLKYFGFKNLMFSSFERKLLKNLKEDFPSAVIGLLYEVYELEEINQLYDFLISELRNYNADFLNLPIEFFRDKVYFLRIIEKLKKAGVKVSFWTVNELKDLNLVKDITDILITDKVELMIKHIKLNG
ncbi:MAG: glycerophosphoryl diester phosphodiesterase [Thermotogaceae bacterium]|jgi:glycerophosphoryl diester phosphodiesterase|nr:glycerophosphoryl diester phosphodiesterase [Thermotogaceae bacterium]